MARFEKGHQKGFKPGQSGNPGGRPKALTDVVDLARTHTIESIDALARIITNEEAPAAARIAAASAMLDRAWGKPTQPLGDGGGGPLQIVIRRLTDAPAT